MRRPAVLLAGFLMAAVPATFGAEDQAPAMRGTFVCGHDLALPVSIPLTWPAVVLAGDGRLFVPCPQDKMHPADHREFREADVIARGLASPDLVIRWRAAQATARLTAPALLGELRATSMVIPACNARAQVFGGIESPRRWQPGQLFALIADKDRAVRREVAYTIGVRLANRAIDPDLAAAAGVELRACFSTETDAEIQGLILEALGAAQYGNDETRSDAERFITQQATGHPLRVLGAAKGLEALVRQNPQRKLELATLVRLRQLVLTGNRAIEPAPGNVDARIRRLALAALLGSGDLNLQTMAYAVDDRDWQVRRLLAGRLNAGDADHAGIMGRLMDDPAFQVRYDLLSAQARVASRTGVCEAVVARFDDASPAVAMRAMDVLAGTCTDLDDGIKKLVELADKLKTGDSHADWHLPTRALTNLARLRPTLAGGERLKGAANHPVWQVRAAAAAACAVLPVAELARILADDKEPNVRTAAIEALVRMRDATVVEKSIAALDWSDDHQLLRTAALSLKGLPDAQKSQATEALLRALRKLTDKEWDTSRDPRVAMLDRLAETMTGDRTPDLMPYVADFDDAVAAAAAKTFEAIINVPPAEPARRRRYPAQPALQAFTILPTQATITLREGIVTLRLLSDVAPVTVARFAQLARGRFYDDKTFHRIVTNFVVQGGSPGANEYIGTDRYMRDEVGPQAPHLRGAVGISTRGGDTGDGQIFIDLVDLPRLDRDYTVFAYVTQGMELIDRMLDGAKIVSIAVR